jgi:hypothetical protein
MEEARELERRKRIMPSQGGVLGIAPAPVAERIQHLRAALDELEQELAAANGSRADHSGRSRRAEARP